MDVSELNAAFGAYFRAEGQGLKDFKTKIYQPIATELFFNHGPTVNTENRMVKALIGQVLRKWQKAITAASSTSFKPQKINTQKLTYEVRDLPDDIEESYAGFLALNDTNDKRKWTIVQYIINELMLPTGREEYELNEVYKGVSGVIVPGTANNPGENFDGLEVQMNNAVAATDLTPIDGPVSWDADPQAFVGEIEQWVEDVKALENEYRLLLTGNAVKYLHMAPELVDRLARGVFKDYDPNYKVTSNDIMQTPTQVRLPFTNLIAVGLPSMIGRERIFMTPELNKKSYIKKPKSEGIPHIQEEGREVVIFADFHKAIGFWDYNYVMMTQHEVPE